MERLAVIFDMDGVLVDSYAAHFQSWRDAVEAEGLQITQEQFARTFGRTSREIIAELWGGDLFTPAKLEEFDRRKEAAYREIVAENFPAMDGARELIEALHESGFRLAIGSSGPPENVALALDRLGVARLFDGRVTGKDVQRGKPDPQVFLLAAERIGIPPAGCAVIEDAPVGVTAANRAGMTSIGLATGGRSIEELSHACLAVHSLRELSSARIDDLVRSRAEGGACP
ncbi:MAG TPA: HAD family phosphatase [Planctomycetaceae bacterium]|nr:HAD family phosphatase [Planctomycetaceae bacterium]